MILNIQQCKEEWCFLTRRKFIIIINLSPYDNDFVGCCCFLFLNLNLCSVALQMNYYALKVRTTAHILTVEK